MANSQDLDMSRQASVCPQTANGNSRQQELVNIQHSGSGDSQKSSSMQQAANTSMQALVCQQSSADSGR